MVPAPSSVLPSGCETDQTAFVAAVRSVQRYLRCLGCPPDELGDLVQDTMLAGLARWPDAAPPVPWLLGTARNLFRRRLRDQQRRAALLDLARWERVWQQTVRDGTGEAMRAALQHCLRTLPERARTVLDLRYGEALPRAAIAARTGLGDEGIKSQLVRTRKALADCMRRRMADE